MKTCRSCKESKDETAYYLGSNKKLMAQCKVCVLAHRTPEDPIKSYLRHKEQRQKNPEIFLKRTREWRKRNLEKDAYRAALYRARKLKQTPIWADLEKIKEIYLLCPKGYHVDHIIPLKGKIVSGFHVPENLQYLPAKENLKKRNFYAGDIL